MISLFLTGLYWVLNAYLYILLFYIIGSWIPELRRTRIYDVVRRLADPYMRIFRGIIVFGQMDFTPILGFLLLRFIISGLLRAIYIFG